MSRESSLTLDHIALVTPGLEASKQDYERLGFQLTPESSHKGKVPPDGPVEIWGSGNHCAMFRQGYLEILGITDPGRYHEHFRVLLDRFHGVRMVALGCESAEKFYETNREKVPQLIEPLEIGRDVPYGKGTKEGLFRVVQLEEGAFPEAELLFIGARYSECAVAKGPPRSPESSDRALGNHHLFRRARGDCGAIRASDRPVLFGGGKRLFLFVGRG